MTIAVCGSLTFYKEIRDVQKKLESLGHKALVPKSIPMLESGTHKKPETVAERLEAESKHDFIQEHFRKVELADAVLVVNPKKNGVEGYIGGNTFLEMGVAFYLKKKIYLLYPVPKMAYELELASMRPVILRGNVSSV